MIKSIEITKEVKTKPMGVVLYSLGGLGKTTFLSEFIKDVPNGVLFQCGEDGLSDLGIKDVPHYPELLGVGQDQDALIKSYEFFRDDLLKFLMVGDHKHPVVAFDNFDNIINNGMDAYVVKNVYNNDLAKANGWGGAKLKEMSAELAIILGAFEYIQKRGVTIIVSTHGQTINFRDPSVEDYKKWSMAVPAREDYNLRNQLLNWSTMTLFGTIEVEVDGKKAKGDRRVLKSRPCAAWDAKTRKDIPDTVDFNYTAFKEAMKKVRANG